MLCRCQQRRQVEICVGSDHKIHTVVGHQLLPQAFCHASGHADEHAPAASRQSFAPFGGKGAQPCADTLLGVVADRAGVEHNGIRIGDIIGHVVAGKCGHRGYDLAVGNVHLAAVCLHIEPAAAAIYFIH